VVRSLPFAAQPALHNPVSLSTPRAPTVCFAGTYYRHLHFERQRHLDALLDGASAHGLVIYDRTSASESGSFGFPDRFEPFVRPALPYEEIVRVYKLHRVFLNTNSVIESPTMFSRRVFELLACGTPIVSTPSRGMTDLFGDIVASIEQPQDAEHAIQRLLTDDRHWVDISQRGIRRVLGRHTYAHRLAEVAAAVGLNYDQSQAAFSLGIDAVDDPAVDAAIEMVRRQTIQPVEAVIAGDADVAGRFATATGISARAVPAEDADRAERARRIGRAVSHRWVALVSGQPPDAATVLEDLHLATKYCRAEIIGEAPDLSARHTYQIPELDSIFIESRLLRSRGVPLNGEEAARWFAEGNRCYSAEPRRVR
jgi:hypothetical protein